MNYNKKERLQKEFISIGYGLMYINDFSEEAKEYIIDRYHRGIEELKAKKEYPTETGDNGYTRLLGVWRYTKSGGLDSAISKKTVWMATLLNDELI